MNSVWRGFNTETIFQTTFSNVHLLFCFVLLLALLCFVVLFSNRYYSNHAGVMTWTWWRHQRETFSALLAICAGNSPVRGEFPAQRPVMRSFDVFFDLCLNKRLSKQSWGWRFETLSRPLRRHCNDMATLSASPALYGKTNSSLSLQCRHMSVKSQITWEFAEKKCWRSTTKKPWKFFFFY